MSIRAPPPRQDATDAAADRLRRVLTVGARATPLKTGVATGKPTDEGLDPQESKRWADRAYVLDVVAYRGYALEWASKELRADREVVLNAVRWRDPYEKYDHTEDVFRFASDALRDDRGVAMIAVRQSETALRWASARLRADPDVVRSAVEIHGTALAYASAAIKANRSIALYAIANGNGKAMEYTAAALRTDRDFVLAAVAKNGDALQFVSDELRADRAVVLEAVKQSTSSAQFMADELASDRDFVLTLVAHDGDALDHVSPELKDDRGVVLAAIDNYGAAFAWASDALKADKEVALRAMTNDPSMIQYTHGDLHADRDFMLTAVAANHRVLAYNDADELKADPDWMLKAIALGNGEAMAWADPALQTDVSFVIQAMRTNYRAWHSLPHAVGPTSGLDLRPEVVKTVVEQHGDSLKRFPPKIESLPALRLLAAATSAYYAIVVLDDMKKDLLKYNESLLRLAIVGLKRSHFGKWLFGNSDDDDPELDAYRAYGVAASRLVGYWATDTKRKLLLSLDEIVTYESIQDAAGEVLAITENPAGVRFKCDYVASFEDEAFADVEDNGGGGGKRQRMGTALAAASAVHWEHQQLVDAGA